MDSRRRFQRATVIWIYLPICLSALLALGLLISLTAASGGGNLESLSQVAIVILAVILLAAGFTVLVFCIAAAFGIGLLVDLIPRHTDRLRWTTARVARTTHTLSNAVARPFIIMAGIRAMGASVLDSLRDAHTERALRRGGRNDQTRH